MPITTPTIIGTVFVFSPLEKRGLKSAKKNQISNCAKTKLKSLQMRKIYSKFRLPID
jgi:hypothetical protein